MCIDHGFEMPKCYNIYNTGTTKYANDYHKFFYDINPSTFTDKYIIFDVAGNEEAQVRLTDSLFCHNSSISTHAWEFLIDNGYVIFFKENDLVIRDRSCPSDLLGYDPIIERPYYDINTRYWARFWIKWNEDTDYIGIGLGSNITTNEIMATSLSVLNININYLELGSYNNQVLFRVFTECNESMALPTMAPSQEPSYAPTMIPTNLPTIAPTESPSKNPSKEPTLSPIIKPTKSPVSTGLETVLPTSNPTTIPSNVATKIPSNDQTDLPTTTPSSIPTQIPIKLPILVNETIVIKIENNNSAIQILVILVTVLTNLLCITSVILGIYCVRMKLKNNHIQNMKNMTKLGKPATKRKEMERAKSKSVDDDEITSTDITTSEVKVTSGEEIDSTSAYQEKTMIMISGYIDKLKSINSTV